MYMRKIVKSGGAFIISLPKVYLRQMGIEEGDYVQITKQKDQPKSPIIILPIKKKNKKDLHVIS